MVPSIESTYMFDGLKTAMCEPQETGAFNDRYVHEAMTDVAANRTSAE